MPILILFVAFFVGYMLINFLYSVYTKNVTNINNKKNLQKNKHKNWFDILEVPETSNIIQIKNAYYQQITKYHPDKVAHLGKEIRLIAEEKTKEINFAYQIAIRNKKH